MWRAIGITDIHMAQRHTRYRSDVGDDIIAKLRYVMTRCMDEHRHLLVAGDWFHSAHVGYATLARLAGEILPTFSGEANIHEAAPLELLSITGQHDLPDHGDWLKGPAYPLLWLPHVRVFGVPMLHQMTWWYSGEDFTWPAIAPLPFGSDYHHDGFWGTCNPDIILIHDMIVPKPVPWDHITFDDFATLVPDGKQRLVFCGDYHAGFEPTQVRNLLFVNPGALTRIKRDEAEREPKYADIKWDGESFEVTYHVIPHRPGDEVFDMSDYGAETLAAPEELSAFVEQVRALDSDATEIDIDAVANELWASIWPDTEPKAEVIAVVRRALQTARSELGYGG